MNPTDRKAILIIHPGGLGDVLLSLPAIAAMRRHYDGYRMVMLAGSSIGDLLKTCGIVDCALTTESGDLASLMGGAVSPPLRHLLANCAAVVGWLRDSDGVLEATLRQLGVSRICLGPPTPRQGVHQSRRFFQVWGEPEHGDRWAPHLVIPETLAESASRILGAIGIQGGQGFVVCHPGSGSIHKCVRPETMAEVIRNLHQLGVRPVVVGGPADSDAVGRVRECGLRDVPVIEDHSLTTMTGVLARSSLFVGHDSGLTHLAAMLGIPTVAMFGPTDPRQWAPLGTHVSVITGPPCSCSTWEQVRRCERKPCLSISADAIIAVCDSMFGRYRSVTKS